EPAGPRKLVQGLSAEWRAEMTEDKEQIVALVVDDDPAMCELVQSALERRGYDVTTTQNADQALHLLQDKDFDVVATDLNMKGMSGIDLCRKIVANREDTPVVVITAFGSMETAVAAIRAGAYDFVTKPFEMESLALTLERAKQHRKLREELKRLRRAVKEK